MSEGWRARPDRRTRAAWALRRGGGTPLLLGITPAAKIRFDCCVQVPVTFEADGDIGCQRTPGGDHANRPRLAIVGLPAIEIYRTTRVGARDGLARVAIAIPVAPRRHTCRSASVG